MLITNIDQAAERESISRLVKTKKVKSLSPYMANLLHTKVSISKTEVINSNRVMYFANFRRNHSRRFVMGSSKSNRSHSASVGAPSTTPQQPASSTPPLPPKRMENTAAQVCFLLPPLRGNPNPREAHACRKEGEGCDPLDTCCGKCRYLFPPPPPPQHSIPTPHKGQFNQCLMTFNYCKACPCFKNLLNCLVNVQGTGHAPCGAQMKARSNIAEDLCHILNYAPER